MSEQELVLSVRHVTSGYRTAGSSAAAPIRGSSAT